MSKEPIAYRLTPAYPPEPGSLSTACVMTCMATGKILSGSGGGGAFLAPEVFEMLRGGDCTITKNQPHEYGHWLIWRNPSPLESDHMNWCFAKKGSRDEIDCGHASSLVMAKQSCDYHDECDAEAATPEGQAEAEAQALRFCDKYGEIVATIEMARALDQLLKLPGIGNLPGFASGLHIQRARTALENFNEYHPGTVKPDPGPG